MLILIFVAANCNSNSGFQPVASGGDGVVVQYCMYLLLDGHSARSLNRFRRVCRL
jgi:hypothetical protein